ncbi:MAG: DUF4097 family beta strand repeat protein [Ktedonobacteraceae bacterium]|nr:DUF4097 family beta strand repeat protein [Ktedonobacteraceae bacterium]
MQSQQQFPGERRMNTDPREQQEQGVRPVNEERIYSGEPGTAWRGGEKLRPESPRGQPVGRRRKSGPVWLVVLLLAALLLGGGIMGLGTRLGSSGAIASQTFNTVGVARLIVNQSSGDVRIHRGGNSNTVVVNGTKHTFFLTSSNDTPVRYSQSGDTITVSANAGGNFLSDVDLDITVPETTNLEIRDGSGDVTIENVNGQVTAQSGSGEIKLNNTTGQAILTAGSGNIEMEGAILQGQSVLKTGSGNIDFTGRLDPAGTYRMETGSGDVRLNLPEDSSFQLTTTTGSGDVDNEFRETTVGNGQHAPLFIKTGSGNIDIRMQNR